MKLLKFSLLSLLFIWATGLLSANETIFNGKDLTGWSAEDMSYWSVQNGAIVGTKGDQKIPGNQFLWYDKKVSDFKLTLQVKQVPFAANAGIQFRSNVSLMVMPLAIRQTLEKVGGVPSTMSTEGKFWQRIKTLLGNT